MSKKCFICGKSLTFYFKKNKFDYFKCKSCHLVSTFPFPRKKALVDHYSEGFKSGNYKLLNRYAAQYKNNYIGMADKLENELKKRNQKIKNSSILDVGCFTGEFMEILQKKGANVYGIELQRDAIQISSKKLVGKIKQGDIVNLKNEFPKNNFDCITMLGLIEHVIDPEKVLRKASTLLRKGGILMIQTPNSSSIIEKIAKSLWPPYTPMEHIHLFSDKALRIELDKLNFKDFTIIRHYKKMPISYIYGILGTFGPTIRKTISPFYRILPKFLKGLNLRFYIGESIIFAIKN